MHDVGLPYRNDKTICPADPARAQTVANRGASVRAYLMRLVGETFLSKEATPEARYSGQVTGMLGWIERRGNQLPDHHVLVPLANSVSHHRFRCRQPGGFIGSAPTGGDPQTGGKRIRYATSLLSCENLARLWISNAQNFYAFHPLGYVLVVMLGAGGGERSGLFASAMRAGVRDTQVLC